MADAQNVEELQPCPQQLTVQGEAVEIPGAYRLLGTSEANPNAAVALLGCLPGNMGGEGTMTIYIGEKEDECMRKFRTEIPEHAEGYYLRVSRNEIVLAGHDERGTYYAVQTLRRLLHGGKVPQIEVRDYPSVPCRGVVEGFYGTPWSHEARLRQIRFCGENKMNTYIYGPKDDPYHSSPHWRKPYPEKEAAQLKELVETARMYEVDFVWAIHPGKDIRWNQNDRDSLLGKFEQMYALGVRSFAVFFDDISGEGTDPDRQAELLNYIDDYFVKKKAGVKPLLMCPTEYNRSWANPESGYLPTLGKKLHPSVRIMWTGDRVVSDITVEGVDWVNGYIGRPAYIWWNFPVSDYIRNRLLLGPVCGNDAEIAGKVSGFVSNPMEHAEASKIAIYGVAAYAWNPVKYDARRAWKAAIRELLPGAADALECFASHSADLGSNRYKFRREESADFVPFATRLKSGGQLSAVDLDALQEKFERMTEAADTLLANKENEALIKEVAPWLLQFRTLAEMGRAVAELPGYAKAKDRTDFLNRYNRVLALQRQMCEIDKKYNQNPHQPGVRVATKVVKPLVDALFESAVRQYNRQNEPRLRTATDDYASLWK